MPAGLPGECPGGPGGAAQAPGLPRLRAYPAPRPAPGQEDARRRALKHGGGSVQVDQLSHRSEGSGTPGGGGKRPGALGGFMWGPAEKEGQGPLPLPGL